MGIFQSLKDALLGWGKPTPEKLVERITKMFEAENRVRVECTEKHDIYGRFMMLWLVERTPDTDVKPSKFIKHGLLAYANVTGDLYECIKLGSKILGNTLVHEVMTLVQGNDDTQLERYSRDMVAKSAPSVAAIKEIVRKNGWKTSFDGQKMIAGPYLVIPVIAYIMRLAGYTNVSQVTPFDVRTVLMMSCEDTWKKTPIEHTLCNSPIVEGMIIDKIVHNAYALQQEVSLDALRRETEAYVREHLRIEPMQVEPNYQILLNDIKMMKQRFDEFIVTNPNNNVSPKHLN